jgi:histidinol-phosphate phosphatase family protein
VTELSYSVVVPTVGRPSLRPLLAALAAGTGPVPEAVVVVDDRPAPATPLDLPEWPVLQVVPGDARGPAAARNAGWRATATPWVAFLDDDVLPPPDWPARLAADLAGLPAAVAGSQGRVRVPLPADRRPTDWERVTAGLAEARWATADMAFRRRALVRVGGFDERFGRAYREDADLALRLLAAGAELVRGDREVIHPVRPEPRWASVRAQRGNADDALMARLHGRDWRERADAPRGRFRRHLAVTAAGAVSLAGLAAGRVAAARAARAMSAMSTGGTGGSGGSGGSGGTARLAGLRSAGVIRRSGRGRGADPRWPRAAAVAGGAAWLVGTAEFAAARIAPGPRTAGEVARMLATSVAIPPAAVAHRLRGELAHRRAEPAGPAQSAQPTGPAQSAQPTGPAQSAQPTGPAQSAQPAGPAQSAQPTGPAQSAQPAGPAQSAQPTGPAQSAQPAGPAQSAPPLAVLFDRDGTLIDDVPYNGDPELVRPVPGALAALARLRARGVPVGVVSNQSGVGRGLLTRTEVDRVNARVEELLGPFDSWQVCPHAPGDECGCRKPAPGLVLAAAADLGVPVDRCVVIGDIGADLGAARSAGARAVLVPTAVTRPQEVAEASEAGVVAADLLTAVDLALAGRAR